jgi:hypothetical protein
VTELRESCGKEKINGIKYRIGEEPEKGRSKI